MNKGDLIEKIAVNCDISKMAAEQVLKSMLGIITEAVAEGEKVSLLGFGTFSVNDRAARRGRNPQTGKPIQIPARKVLKFKAGSKLLEAANQ